MSLPPDIIARHESCSVARPLTPPTPSLSVCVPCLPRPSANFQRCRRGHSEGRTLQGGERLVGRGDTRRTTLWVLFFFYLQLSVFVSLSPSLLFGWANRPRTTLREPGGEPTSTWRTRSTTRDGSLSTSSAKVSASVCAAEGETQHWGVGGTDVRQLWA